MASPVLNGGVLRVVWKTKFDCLLSGDVGVQTAGVGGSLLYLDANEFSDVGANPVSTNDSLVMSFRAVMECDGAVLGVKINGLGSKSAGIYHHAQEPPTLWLTMSLTGVPAPSDCKAVSINILCMS